METETKKSAFDWGGLFDTISSVVGDISSGFGSGANTDAQLQQQQLLLQQQQQAQNAQLIKTALYAAIAIAAIYFVTKFLKK